MRISPRSGVRLHALDNLRATMMWLGLVIHVSGLHRTRPGGLEWSDPRTHPLADLLGMMIHAFRMPVFFLVAGFFVALLIERRGAAGMLRNRALRVGVPFVLFWPPVFASLVVVSTLLAQPSGQFPQIRFDLSTMPATPSGARLQTAHLWFLEFLASYAAAAAIWHVAALKVPRAWREAVATWMRTHVMRVATVAAVSFLLGVVARHHSEGIVDSSGEFVPSPSEWIYYALFFGLGIHVHRERVALMPQLRERVWINAAAGTACFSAVLLLIAARVSLGWALPFERVVIGTLYAASSCFWSFALVGGFLAFASGHSRTMGYLSGSAYWVYLAHLPVIGAVELLMREWDASFGAKLIANVLLTTLICLSSYEAMVRRTWIGRLLNGTGFEAPTDAPAGGPETGGPPAKACDPAR